jgi:hypothetical protein
LSFKLIFQPEAGGRLHELEHGSDLDLKKLAKVRKCLARIETNPQHPGLRPHRYRDLKGRNGEDVWESYVENNVSTAWQVFWHYGPGQGVITIVAVTPHPWRSRPNSNFPRFSEEFNGQALAKTAISG